jgi:hypothetical protein
MAIAAMIAVAGTVAMLWMDFGPGSDSRGGSDGLTTASVVSRAGAIATPSEPPPHLEIPQTVPVP